MKRFDGKIVLITGASSGIGEASARSFAELGAKLILVARRKENLEKLADEFKSKFKTESLIIQLDVTKRKETESKIEAIPAEWKNIDILFNCAGLALGLDKVQDLHMDDIDRVIQTNVLGLLYVTRLILPGMIARNSGHIINMGSIAGHDVYPGGSIYCASKYAVDAITKTLKIDTLGHNIRVSTVDPGMVNTDFSTIRFKGDKERADGVYKGIDALVAEDIADAVIYCATRPPHVNINEIVMMPVQQGSVVHNFRKS